MTVRPTGAREDFRCIENTIEGTKLAAGDIVTLDLDQQPDEGCFNPVAIEETDHASQHAFPVHCTQQTSIDHIEDLEYSYGITPDEIIGVTWTLEHEPPNGDYQVLWETEGDIQDIADRQIINTVEDENGFPLNTYRYSFTIPFSLSLLAFRPFSNDLPETDYIAANYWLDDQGSGFFSVPYIGIGECRVME